MRALSLDQQIKQEEDNDLNNLKKSLDNTNNLVLLLNKQIEGMKESVAKKLDILFD
jgi:hypothetical protein